MKKFVIIPDSFKGTLSSSEFCTVATSVINKICPNIATVCIPVADGGEGSVDCFLSALNGEKVRVSCLNPYLEKVESFYGLIDNGKTAVIEMAAAAGLPMVENRKNPMLTSTYGVGELIMHAINAGVKKIILGLGGSCTNDFGCGAAVACGAKFYDDSGKEFLPTGGTLNKISKIDTSKLTEVIRNVEIVTMCDIDNPPYGSSGASYIFAPQKGATEEQVKLLDDGVKHLCSVIKNSLNISVDTLSGGGAAGAMGAGMVAFFNSTLQMGIKTVLDTVNFASLIKDADYIITGEGKIDGQSLRGKVVIGVAREAKKQGVPVFAVVGGAEEGDLSKAYEEGVTAIFTINRLPQDFSISRHKTAENLQFALENILRTLCIK